MGPPGTCKNSKAASQAVLFVYMYSKRKSNLTLGYEDCSVWLLKRDQVRKLVIKWSSVKYKILLTTDEPMFKAKIQRIAKL